MGKPLFVTSPAVELGLEVGVSDSWKPIALRYLD